MNKNYAKIEQMAHFYDQKGLIHNLHGPARVTMWGTKEYAIHGRAMTKKEWEKHPLVIAFNIEKLLYEIMSEDL